MQSRDLLAFFSRQRALIKMNVGIVDSEILS